MLFVEEWMKLETTMFSTISETKKGKYCFFHMWSLN
jgi:hypothetical protein